MPLLVPAIAYDYQAVVAELGFLGGSATSKQLAILLGCTKGKVSKALHTAYADGLVDYEEVRQPDGYWEYVWRLR
jgi:transcription initiation factor IIE alpha subunit